MPRARVSPEKRKRSARACDSCKRAKLKCNGLYPCNTCGKNGRNCSFGGLQRAPDERQPPHKRQMLDGGTDQVHGTPRRLSVHLPPFNSQFVGFSPVVNTFSPALKPPHTPEAPANPRHEPSTSLSANCQADHTKYEPSLPIFPNPSDTTTQDAKDGSGAEEEAVVYNFPRLLEDPTGRLQYLGDSATLSYLQIIRKDVESIAGPSRFTTDPRQHRIVENTATLPQSLRNTYQTPGKATANVLVDAFFVNTSGLVQVFNYKSFVKNLDDFYSDQRPINASWQCLFHLTLAIGLVLATPQSGTEEDVIIRRLRAEEIDRAELFFCNARAISDPTLRLESADFSSIQALLLMTIYALAVSKRTAAFAYCGMASRSGFALGLHREETLAIFSVEEQALRRNVWRSVFVLDGFLAASMGRPPAISEDDCSAQTLNGETKLPVGTTPIITSILISTLGLEASVRICRVVGTILKRVYSKRKISTKLAQEIADECGLWPSSLDPSLHWRQMTAAILVNPYKDIAILHVNLLYCHSIILLTRPFFLFLLNKVQKDRAAVERRSRRKCSQMDKFSEACVSASCHSILLAQHALDGSYLSCRDPFITYYVFASALIVLSNEFFKLYAISAAQRWIQTSIAIMTYCAETDPIASRLLFILSSFRDVVNKQTSYIATHQLTTSPEDPILNFFKSGADDLSPGATRRSSIASANFAAASAAGTGSSSANMQPMSQLSHSSQPRSGSSCSPGHRERHNSLDGNDSYGEAEIHFDYFWGTPVQPKPEPQLEPKPKPKPQWGMMPPE